MWARLDFRGPTTPGERGSGVVLGHNGWARLVGKKPASPKSAANLARRQKRCPVGAGHDVNLRGGRSLDYARDDSTRLEFKLHGGVVVVPVAEVEGDGGLVIDVAVLGVFNHTVVPHKVLPVYL